MSVSERKADGQVNHCPTCNADLFIDPLKFYGDVKCESCNSLGWFLNLRFHTHVFKHAECSEMRRQVIQVVADHFGVTTEQIENSKSLTEEFEADSLDAVELVMSIEEELGLE